MRRRQAHVSVYERKRGSPWPNTLTQALQALASANSSRMLLLRAPHFIAAAQDAAVEIIDLVREAEVPILWVAAPDRNDTQTSISDILRLLLVQTFGEHAAAFGAHDPFPLTTAHIQSAHADPSQWPQILAKAVSDVGPQVWVVIDTSTLPLRDGMKSDLIGLLAQLEQFCTGTVGTKGENRHC